MSSAVFLDTARSELLRIAAGIDNGLARMSGQAATGKLRVTISELLKDWAAFIGLLELGPPRGYCWTRLEPPDSKRS